MTVTFTLNVGLGFAMVVCAGIVVFQFALVDVVAFKSGPVDEVAFMSAPVDAAIMQEAQIKHHASSGRIISPWFIPRYY